MSQESPQEQQGPDIHVPINWRPAEAVPVYLGNQFMLQFVGDGYILSFGQVTPPAIIGPTQENVEQIDEIPVYILGRVSMTPERTRALMLLLRRQLLKFHPELVDSSDNESPEGKEE